MKRSSLLNLLKIAFAACLVWYVIHKAGWENVRDSLANIHVGTWVLGLATIFIGTCVSIVRWYVLMRSVNLDTTLWTVFRLSWIGVFFNNIVPGLTGGDLVKAFYVTREHPRQRTDAVISVIVDRVIGIVALALIAACVIPFDFARYHEVAIWIYAFVGAAGVGAVLVLSRRVKARLRRLATALGRKPRAEGADSMLGKLDRAISMYRHSLGAVALALGMSVVVHLLLIVGIWFFGDALSHAGMASIGSTDPAAIAARQVQLDNLNHLGLSSYCSIVPIIMIVSSIPVAPAGWGVGEQMFVYFFGTVGVAARDATALSLTYRLTATLISLLGGVFLVVDRKRVLHDLPQGEGQGA